MARDHGMIGIVLNAEISAPSLACFVRGSHEAGTFGELLLHHQFETENKQAGNQYWVFHGAVYRCVFGHNTAGEMIDPSSGIRTEAPKDYEHKQETCIKPQSYAWTNSYQEACSRWLNFVSSAIMRSVDFITGDGNLFSQRNFKRDSHSDFKSCILVDLLERLLDGALMQTVHR